MQKPAIVHGLSDRLPAWMQVCLVRRTEVAPGNFLHLTHPGDYAEEAGANRSLHQGCLAAFNRLVSMNERRHSQKSSWPAAKPTFVHYLIC